MRVLITGASGFIGRHVLRELQHRGIDTIVVGRTCPDGADCFHHVDLLAENDWKKIFSENEITHFIHLAWYVEHSKFWTSPENWRWVDATTKMVEAFCVYGGKKIIFSGTCAEYDWSSGYCREAATPLEPSTTYGVAKDVTRRIAEKICFEYGVSCVWGRIFYPFGIGERPERLIPSLIDVFQGRREAFEIKAKAYRDLLHVSDVASAMVTLLGQDFSGAYNICSGSPVALEDVVVELAKILNANPDCMLDLQEKDLPTVDLLIGCNRRLLATGWHPAVDLQQGLRDICKERQGENE
jgi:nucleoside-diphosphate-sugar epimerase